MKKSHESCQPTKSTSLKKNKEPFRFASKEEAKKALSNFNGNEMVKIANVSENCCAIVSYFNSLRSYEERLSFVGGEDRMECPTAYFREICGSPDNGYNSEDYSKYFQTLEQNKHLSEYIFRKLRGYEKDKDSGQYYFHASNIFKLQRGTTVLFFGYSLPREYTSQFKSILREKRDVYTEKDYDPLKIERMLEIYTNAEVNTRGSLLFEFKKAYVQDDPHPHVCAVSVDKDGCIYKYDNSNERERERIMGLEDLLPFIFEYWATYVIKLTVKK